MSYPTKDTKHVAEGLAYLIGLWRNKPVMQALLTAFMNRVQDIENVLWSVLQAGQLATPPTGNALDQVGDLVGAERGGLNDAQFLIFVKAFVRARRSEGKAEDILQTLAVVLAGFLFVEWYPAAFEVTQLDMTDAYVLPIVLALRIARPAGVYGAFVYTTWATSTNWVLGSVYDGTAGQNGLGSVYDGTVGGVVASAEAI